MTKERRFKISLSIPFCHVMHVYWFGLIPLAARSKAWVCGLLFVETEGSNPAEGVDAFLVIVVYLHIEVCDCLITRPEESYRVWCVCDREVSLMGGTWPVRGCRGVVGDDWFLVVTEE